MKKIIFLVIALVVTGAIFFISQKNTTEVVVKKPEIKIEESIVIEKKPVVMEVKPQQAEEAVVVQEKIKKSIQSNEEEVEVIENHIVDSVVIESVDLNSDRFDNSFDVVKEDIYIESNESKELKKILLVDVKKIHSTIFEEVKKVPECLHKVNMKEEIYKCFEKVEELRGELSSIIGESLDENVESPKDDNSSKEFVWDEKTKQGMITEIEKVIPIVDKEESCIQNAQNTSDLDTCLKLK